MGWGRLLSVLAGGLLSCHGGVECGPGEVRYQGRPPSRLFAFDSSCRSDCFAAGQDCAQTCGPVAVAEPAGELRGVAGGRPDKMLQLVDPTSIDATRALVLEFGYEDEAHGSAPKDWGLLQAGAASYLVGQVRGTARFVMRAAVATDADHNGSYDLTKEASAAGSEVAEANVGRLDVLDADDTALRGKFYLSFTSLTNQPQGSMLGCFDMGVAKQSTGALRRALVP